MTNAMIRFERPSSTPVARSCSAITASAVSE
jgi:hypothetical protein